MILNKLKGACVCARGRVYVVYGRVPYCAINMKATDVTDLKQGDAEVRCVGSSSALNYDLFNCGSFSVIFSPMCSPLKKKA